MKRVYQYTIDGEFIQEFASATEAAKVLGMKREGIQSVARGVNLVNCGYRWSFEKVEKLPSLSSFDKYDVMEDEEWKVIEGCSHYLVSNKGRVRSTTYVSSGNKGKVEYGRIYNQSTDNNGYKMVSLIDDNGKRCLIRVHRLVAMCFIPNPDELPMINHKNKNTIDNRVENLEWCTAQYNATYDNAVEYRKLLAQKWYVQMDMEGNVIAVYFGRRNAARIAGCTPWLISHCCNGHIRSHKGFKWKFLDDFDKETQEELKEKYYVQV